MKLVISALLLFSLAACASSPPLNDYQKALRKQQMERAMAEPSLYDFKRR